MRQESSISYEEELEVSDRLYARKALRDALREAGQPRDKETPRTPEERAVWRAGEEAANRLVTAYAPYAWSLAHSVWNRTFRRHSLDVDDLYQTASIAMLVCTWSFDAHGPRNADGVPLHTLRDGEGRALGRPGLRFASYAGRHMLKRMNAAVSAASTYMSGNVDVITSTWTFMNTRETLEANNGAAPTTEEVEAASNVKFDSIYRFLPAAAGTDDINEEYLHPQGDEVSETVQTLIDLDYYNGLLANALRLVMPCEEMEMLLLFLGVDNGVPREYPEVARLMKITQRAAQRRERELYDRLRHPRNREIMRRYLTDAMRPAAERTEGALHARVQALRAEDTKASARTRRNAAPAPQRVGLRGRKERVTAGA